MVHEGREGHEGRRGGELFRSFWFIRIMGVLLAGPIFQAHSISVMMLDRGETHASLVGLQHRWRTNSLMNDHQLSHLRAWHVR
jgi:hypothetical protein